MKGTLWICSILLFTFLPLLLAIEDPFIGLNKFGSGVEQRFKFNSSENPFNSTGELMRAMMAHANDQMEAGLARLNASLSNETFSQRFKFNSEDHQNSTGELMRAMMAHAKDQIGAGLARLNASLSNETFSQRFKFNSEDHENSTGELMRAMMAHAKDQMEAGLARLNPSSSNETFSQRFKFNSEDHENSTGELMRAMMAHAKDQMEAGLARLNASLSNETDSQRFLSGLHTMGGTNDSFNKFSSGLLSLFGGAPSGEDLLGFSKRKKRDMPYEYGRGTLNLPIPPPKRRSTDSSREKEEGEVIFDE